jgi:hypothetical protein
LGAREMCGGGYCVRVQFIRLQESGNAAG